MAQAIGGAGSALEHPQEKEVQEPKALDEDIRRRWSPRSFAERAVEVGHLRLLLEAARWAPSSYNEQPWRFIVARREAPDDCARLLECLSEQNREWAEGAPILMLTAASKRFARNGSENRHAFHDVGLAMGNLTNQATSMDLYVHQMAGIDPERARHLYEVPEDFEVVSAVAIGYLGDPEDLDDPGRREAEVGERSRKPLEELVFAGDWGDTAPFVADAAS